MKISERLEKLPPYLFAQIDKKIDDAKKRGIDIISLGIGDPDKPTLTNIVDKMAKAITEPKNHDYPPYQGTSDFRKASADWMKKRFDVELDYDNEMLALIGSKEGLAHVFFAFIDRDDIVLVPDPGYPVYKNATILAGGYAYNMPLLKENKFLPDFDKIPEDIAKKAKLMFLNYPNNPTGAVATLDFYKKAVEFAKKYDILICNDQAYCEMTYDNYKAPSILQVEGAKDIAIEFYSHSKSYNMTGWRLGFACGNKEAINALGIIKNNIDSGVFKAIQEAGIEAYNTPSEEIEKLNKMYQKRRDVAQSCLAELGWEIEPTLGTFYLWLPTPNKMSSSAFCEMVIEKTGVVLVPGLGYGQNGEGYFRIALTKEEDVLKEAFKRLKEANIRFQ